MHHSSDDDVDVSGTVLQRLIQENRRYGNTGVNPENQVMTSPVSLASAETLLPETQPRQEPQGQEHQVDSNSMEKNIKGVQNHGASIQVTPVVPGIGELEPPPYEEAKSQSQLYRGEQGQNEEQNMTGTYVNVHNTAKTFTELGHTHTMLKNTNQALNPNREQNVHTQMSSQPNQHIPTNTSLCPLSLSLASSLCSSARGEGHSWVQQGFTGVDEGLSGLERGHVRSLSERIMQLSLEQNGAKHDREVSPNREKQTAHSPISQSIKTSAAPPSKGSLDPRGPPPDYPFKANIQSAYPSSLSPGPLPLEQTPLSMESLLGQISSLMPLPIPQTGSGTRLPPQGQIIPAEAFSMMSHAQHMMTYLSNENQTLRQELQIQTEKMGKLQRLEAEVQRLSDAYENLVRSSSQRETLDKTMRTKLEGEIRRLHDFNRDLRERLETASRKLAKQEADGQEDDHVYLSERRESLKEIERLEVEAESLCSTNEDQRRHIEILEQALNNAQGKVVRLEEERVGVRESSALALLDRLRQREERILGLEADRMRWEQKYLEESAMRQFAMEAAAAQRMKDLHAQLLEKIAMIKVLQHRSRQDGVQLHPARSVPSIAVATGVHSRQATQTESVLLGRENTNHLPPSLPSSASLSSLTPSLSSFSPLSVSTLPPPSVMSSFSLPLLSSSSSHFSSSSVILPLPSSHSHTLPPLPPTVSSSLPSTPLLSLHSKSASRDSSTHTAKSPESVKVKPSTGRGRTARMDYPTTRMKSPESRVLHMAGQKIQPTDSDLVEILI